MHVAQKHGDFVPAVRLVIHGMDNKCRAFRLQYSPKLVKSLAGATGNDDGLDGGIGQNLLQVGGRFDARPVVR